MRSIKQIGFALLLVLWCPGLFFHGAALRSSASLDRADTLMQANSLFQAQTFHQLRLQNLSGGDPVFTGHDLVRDSQAEQSRLRNCSKFLVASPPNPTATQWHLLNSTELPRAPSI